MNKVWAQVGVDLCSLPETSEGYVGICTCVAADYFSKCIEAKPIYSKIVAEVGYFLYELVCRFGCTKNQINVQHREFCDKVSSSLHALTGTKQHVTSAYIPSTS